jgi:hypothetical protein
VSKRTNLGRAAAVAADPIDVPEGGAVVRMYCTGLGDCFLVTFRGDDGNNRYLMIDCGVWRGTPEATPRMKSIMAAIAAATGGVDVLAVTHEHWDHLSGFKQAEAEFKVLPVGRVWMPWTEDRSDPIAAGLHKRRRQAMASLELAAERLDAEADAARQRAAAEGRAHEPSRAETAANRVFGLLGFFGVDRDDPGAAAKTEDLLEIVRGRDEKPRYLRPGGPIRFPGAGYARVYVLGPPTDLKLLRKVDPSAGAASEVYFGGLAMDPQRAFHVAVANLAAKDRTGLDPEDREALELSFPFDRCHSRAAKKPGGAAKPSADRYNDPAHAWRRIDTDWLESAGHLALDLDNKTNNTSLVMAIELGKGGPVLLFPGDAQVGNWLSWDDAPLKGTTAADLLRRTVLYKVGHHASHNATLREKGLERMTSPDLVAMISVDRKEAKKPKGGNPNGWEMPYGKLLRALVDQTGGRVMRADTGINDPGPNKPPARYTPARWEAFERDAKVIEGDDGRPFYIQYTIEP